ncbi:hypothetical protein KFL_001410190 [Klebsormidium nitens]|uniref:Uncharacterized protein n=1 Tax=Klebsormidium nitens TaxID=105231 RepID=A0A0U9HJQ7_KLENI|nr:hypothetical protein KFL_001410190 [Klebsormidium nitens]|eukprot:GAQ83261.1 hypothetical protein KFL_001410190 [Klebsormidium nitens]
MELRPMYSGARDSASKQARKHSFDLEVKHRVCWLHTSFSAATLISVSLSFLYSCTAADTRGIDVGSLAPHIVQPEDAESSQGDPSWHTLPSEPGLQSAYLTAPSKGKGPGFNIWGPGSRSWGRDVAPNVKRRTLERRRLLQASGSSGSCHYVVVGGTTQSTISTAVCASTTFGSAEPFVACCTIQCANSAGSPALCACTGYSDEAVTCSGSLPLAGCCSHAAGASQANPPALSTGAPVPTVAPNLTPTVVPTLSPTVAPTLAPTVVPSLSPSPLVTTGALVISPPSSMPTAASTVAPYPPPAGSPLQPPPSQGPPSNTQPVAPLAPPSNKGGGGANIRTAAAVAAPLFAFVATAAIWAVFAYRYRTRKEAVVRRTILLCTDRDPTPTLPNRGQYRQELVEENLRKMLTSVLAKWDSWNGCSQKTTFPSRGEFGIWKQRFYGKEAEVLLAALLEVDQGFGSQEGYVGVLDRWQQEQASRSYVVAKLCKYVEEAGEGWSKPDLT